MTDFLTINGVAYAMQAPFRQDVERAGDEFRLYNNSLASQVRSEKQRWGGTTSFLTATEVGTLVTAIANDAPLTCVLLTGGVTTTITARVRIVREVQQIGLYYLTLDIRET